MKIHIDVSCPNPKDNHFNDLKTFRNTAIFHQSSEAIFVINNNNQNGG